ncbi:MAG: hypothetical protein ACK4MD_06585 [Demequina sp.]
MTGRPTALALACVVALTGCGAGAVTPDRAADAVGSALAVQQDGAQVRVQFAHDVGYEYYEGTQFVLGDAVTVTGAVDRPTAIRPGDRLRVWTAACAESFPVQCQVEAVEVLD